MSAPQRIDDAAVPLSGADRVQMRDVRKRFGAIDALRGVSLRVAPGEVVGIAGDNGAGKSTLMKILAGAEVPDSGQIWLDGEEVRLTSPRRARDLGVGMVYQDLSLCEHLDVAQNLFLGREPRLLRGLILNNRDMHAHARRQLDALGIKINITNMPVRNLSGGQRQAVAIARAVTFSPRILVLDEPTAALAVAEVETVLALIRNVSQQGVSVILITHRLGDFFQVCHRIYVMYEGVMRAELDARAASLEELVGEIVGKVPATPEGNPT